MMTAKKMMSRHVRKLRAAGWRVRNGGWPATLKAEARWDFARWGDTLAPMTPEAGRAVDTLCAGGPIPLPLQARAGRAIRGDYPHKTTGGNSRRQRVGGGCGQGAGAPPMTSTDREYAKTWRSPSASYGCPVCGLE
jgi:hypothetical protein